MTKPNLTVIACFAIATVAGIFLWYVPAWLFNWLLVGLVISVLGVIWGLIMALWNWAGKIGMIYPDENGNYPIKMVWRFVIGWKQFGIEVMPVNLNLAGANRYKEWSTWQVTNNRGGSQPRELVAGLLNQDDSSVPLITGPGQDFVIDAVMQEL